jgi:hypothetical protein
MLLKNNNKKNKNYTIITHMGWVYVMVGPISCE